MQGLPMTRQPVGPGPSSSHNDTKNTLHHCRYGDIEDESCQEEVEYYRKMRSRSFK